MRTIILIACLSVISFAISYLFWFNEWKYCLRTLVPANYRPAQNGAGINLNNKLFVSSDKPTFIHFFNPDCPCSKFNIPDFKSHLKMYGAQINFIIVAMNNIKKHTATAIQDKLNLHIPVLFDKAIADSCGVYSTPQAVILDADHKLYFTGNYNSSRYCINQNNNYAQMAIDSLLANNCIPTFNRYALMAYGCQHSGCTK